MNKYFSGIEVSKTGLKNGRVDLGTLRKVVNGVLNNEIVEKSSTCGIEWELISGSVEYCCDMDGNVYTPEKAKERIDELDNMIAEVKDKYYEDDENAEADEDEYEYDEEDEENIRSWKNNIKCLESYLESPELVTIYQYYIISEDAAKLMMRESEEQIIFYCEEFDMYVWGITTYGASWSDILTDIEL